MTKSLAGLLGVAATASVVAPVVLLTGGKEEHKPFKEPAWNEKQIELVNSTDIKNKYKNINCLKEYFSEEIDWNEGNSQSSNEFDISINGDAKACLIVEYYVNNHTSNKWWGGLRLIWSLVDNAQGLITVVNAKALDGNFRTDSSFYVVSKENQKWSVKQQQENEEEIISSQEELSKKFPQSAETTSSVYGNTHFWSFGSSPENICKVNECKTWNNSPNKTTSPIRWNWKKSDGSNEKAASDWCSNFDDWFNNLIPSEKGNKIKEQIKKSKGTWTREGE